MNKFLLSCSFIILSIFSIANTTFAQSEISNHLSIETTINNPSIIYQNGNSYSISFDIENGNLTNPNFKYGVTLLPLPEGESDSSLIVDEKIYKAEPLSKNAKISREINYDIPKFLKSGDYRMLLTSKSENGNILSQVFISDITFVNKGEGIMIDPTSCSLHVKEDKIDTSYTLSQGVDVSSAETLYAKCKVTNNSMSSLNGKIRTDSYLRNSFGKATDSYKLNQSVGMNKGETKEIEIIISKPSNPQAYDTSVYITNDLTNEIISNKVNFHWVLSGKSATIQDISLDKESYDLGTTAMLSFAWTKSADSFYGSRSGKSTSLVNPNATINFCNVSEKFVLNEKEENVLAPLQIPKECNDTKLSLQIKDGEELLSEIDMVLSINKKEYNIFNKSNSIIAIIFVIIILILFIILSKMNTKNGKLSALLFIFVFGSLLVSLNGAKLILAANPINTSVKSGMYTGNNGKQYNCIIDSSDSIKFPIMNPATNRGHNIIPIMYADKNNKQKVISGVFKGMNCKEVSAKGLFFGLVGTSTIVSKASGRILRNTDPVNVDISNYTYLKNSATDLSINIGSLGSFSGLGSQLGFNKLRIFRDYQFKDDMGNVVSLVGPNNLLINDLSFYGAIYNTYAGSKLEWKTMYGDTVRATFNLDKTKYLPGEDIRATGTYDNVIFCTNRAKHSLTVDYIITKVDTTEPNVGNTIKKITKIGNVTGLNLNDPKDPLPAGKYKLYTILKTNFYDHGTNSAAIDVEIGRFSNNFEVIDWPINIKALSSCDLQNQNTVTWKNLDDKTVNGKKITAYKLYRNDVASSTRTTKNFNYLATDSVVTFADMPIVSGKIIEYSIAPVYGSIEMPKSSVVSVTTTGACDNQPPSVPVISGSKSITFDNSFDYTVVSKDSSGLKIKYYIDYEILDNGDINKTELVNFPVSPLIDSNNLYNFDIVWSSYGHTINDKKSFKITASAENSMGLKSATSAPYIVSTPVIDNGQLSCSLSNSQLIPESRSLNYNYDLNWNITAGYNSNVSCSITKLDDSSTVQTDIKTNSGSISTSALGDANTEKTVQYQLFCTNSAQPSNTCSDNLNLTLPVQSVYNTDELSIWLCDNLACTTKKQEIKTTVGRSVLIGWDVSGGYNGCRFVSDPTIAGLTLSSQKIKATSTPVLSKGIYDVKISCDTGTNITNSVKIIVSDSIIREN
jgi:hypothetical protein